MYGDHGPAGELRRSGIVGSRDWSDPYIWRLFDILFVIYPGVRRSPETIGVVRGKVLFLLGNVGGKARSESKISLYTGN